jgi:flagellar assembly protein FliH
MATIIRLADRPHGPHAVAFNFDDLTAQATDHLARASAEAAEIVAQARREADAIRRQAAEEGRRAAAQAAEQMAAEQLSPVISALGQAAADLQHGKQAWLAHWESSAVHLAAAMAARIIRRELRRQPQITLTLVREALELAAGSPSVRLHLNPADHKKLETQVRALIGALAGLGDAEVTADAAVSRGGCLVETRFGAIDQQFESQLKRIEEELTG